MTLNQSMRWTADSTVGPDTCVLAGDGYVVVMDDLTDVPITEAELGILTTFTGDVLAQILKQGEAANDNEAPSQRDEGDP